MPFLLAQITNLKILMNLQNSLYGIKNANSIFHCLNIIAWTDFVQ